MGQLFDAKKTTILKIKSIFSITLKNRSPRYKIYRNLRITQVRLLIFTPGMYYVYNVMHLLLLH